MKAIQTKYFSPTNFKGSRIKASDGDGNSVTVSYDHALNSDQNHIEAAWALLRKMGWRGALEHGWLGPIGVHVFRAGPTNADVAKAAGALAVLLEHALEAHPHFESERGQRDINRARKALSALTDHGDILAGMSSVVAQAQAEDRS